MFRELECDFFAGELLVDVGIGLQLVLDVSLHRFVQVDLGSELFTDLKAKFQTTVKC